MSGRGGAGVVGDSTTRAKASRVSCRIRASKGTRRSGNDAVPTISPGSSLWYPVRGIDCRPEETKRSEGIESS